MEMSRIVQALKVVAYFRVVALAVALSANLSLADDAIKPSPKLPDTTPWNLKELSSAPEFEWVDAKGPVRSLLYKGEPYGGKPTRVFAFYATPGTLAGDESTDKDLPAVVLIHGGGGTAFREWAMLWAKRGYAAIAMDLAGHQIKATAQPKGRPVNVRLSDGGPDQGDGEKFGSVDKAASEQWPYHAVANVIRAHSLLRSFKAVDANRTAVTGISWGGYLTCIVSGLDNRFKAAVPVYGCGFLHENSVWLKRFAKMNAQQRKRWVTLWDPSNYLPAVSMPILFVNGTNDFAYPLDSYMKSFNAVPGTKQMRITVNMRHGHQSGWAPQEIGLFIDQHLREGEPLASIGVPQLDGGEVAVSYTSRVKLSKAALYFTTDTSAINKRRWRTVPAKDDGKRVTASGLPENATAWFITVQDKRGAVVSSTVSFSAGAKK